MKWSDSIWFALPSMILWLGAGFIVYIENKKKLADILMLSGIAIFTTFIIYFWISLERPPLRTMGETRLWYSFFLSLIGYITYKRWNYKWLLTFSGILACVFTSINLFKPEIHSKNLMPALQSYWFIPHVTVYILFYAMLGAATIASFIQIRKVNQNLPDLKLYNLMDNLVYTGFGFLMLGMLMGCIWAKEAWGHYWSWGPKETWAFVTAAAYLVYIHMRLHPNRYPKITLYILSIAFLLLMITWIGVNYLPSAQNSIHTY
ncbi:MAG: cytochrome c biogenesis protein CcsA [Odoribacter sp.]|nr:cytochrome c biogenesis protein CcsA [Odoribacter sp.]